jgi:ribonuclease D
MHKVKKRNHMAVVRELWMARNEVGTGARYLSGKTSFRCCDHRNWHLHRIKSPLPIANILEKILRPLGLRARWLENAATWISCIADAIAMPEDQWPEARSKSDAVPPIKVVARALS